MEREFRIGERVAFVDDDIKGRVKSVKANGDIVVVSQDGFDYTCRPSDIVSQEEARAGLSEYIKDADWDYVTNDKYAERRRPTPPSNKNLREAPVRVLDLHIEKLVKSTRGMASGDILDYQLRYARTAVESARREGVVRRMVFVHGVGDGVLKEELRRMLEGYSRTRFYDAAFHVYGEGATEVEFY